MLPRPPNVPRSVFRYSCPGLYIFDCIRFCTLFEDVGNRPSIRQMMAPVEKPELVEFEMEPPEKVTLREGVHEYK